MLKGMLAPANFFLFQPLYLGQLLSRGKIRSEKSLFPQTSSTKNTETPSLIQKDTYKPAETSQSSFQLFQNSSAEDFVAKLLGSKKTEKTGLSSSGGQLKLDLKVRYNFSSRSKQEIKSGSGNTPSRRVVKQTVVKKYNSSRASSVRVREREKNVRLFYRQTESTTSKISKTSVEGYRGVRNKVAATFNYDFSLDVGFLHQFANQAEKLNEHSGEALDGYVSTTDALLDKSTQATKSFFNSVDTLLEESRMNFISRVEEFFSDLKTAYGGDDSRFENEKNMMVEQVMSFFDKVGSLLDEAEVKALNVLSNNNVNPAESDPAAQMENPTQTEEIAGNSEPAEVPVETPSAG